jgi:phosphatidylglycerophosphatase A
MNLRLREGRLDMRTWAACGFGLGFAPWAPGTVATAGIAVLWGLIRVHDPLLEAGIIVFLTVSGLWLCAHAERLLGKDASPIVWDEFAGFALAAFMLPKSIPVLALAFALFRLFDIFKPFPAGAVQKWRGGPGVVADDLIAGLYANLAAHALLYVLLTGSPS